MPSANYDPNDPINLLTREIISAAIDVHKEIGPGLLESAYEACLVHELTDRGVKLERQKPLPVTYHGVQLDCGYRLDLLVEDSVIVELKSIEAIEKIHSMQVLSYLRMSGYAVGLLINFNVPVLINGVRRIVNNLKSK
jgi:GxxExxY protein